MSASHGEQGGGRAPTWLAVAKLQRDLYAAVKSDPLLKKYPVWSISEGGGAVDNVGLSGVNVFLVFRVHALEALRKPLTLLPEAGFFFLAQLVLAGLKTLLQIIDLLVEIFDFVLPRCELRLQLRGRQLALRSGNDGLANADDADLACCGRTSRGRRLRPGGYGAQNARGGEGNGTSQHIS